MTISTIVLLFGVFVLLLTVRLVRANHVKSDNVLPMFVVLVIIICVVFLVVAGYTDRQIVPAIGLLGTIVGYLLGRHGEQPPAMPQTEQPSMGPKPAPSPAAVIGDAARLPEEQNPPLNR